MKPVSFLRLISFFCLLNFNSFGQSGDEQQLGLPGDNLNLYAVMKLFQESPTLEGFEKSLNDESLKINNLDLDGDNQVDYITVEDNIVEEVHNIVLKVAVGNNENQDVAVIAVQKEKDGTVNIQLVGDEDLYGTDYIVEPNYENGAGSTSETPNPGYQTTANQVVIEKTTPVQVAAWPVIQFIFVPGYNRWYSPWHWGYYPGYWRPWKPFYWHYYYGFHYHWNYYYYGHYRRWNTYRIPGWRTTYYRPGSFRSRSVIVQTRVKQGHYKQTYSRPQLARDGAATFKKDFPKAPGANNKLPPFDKTGRPVIGRPIQTRPVTRPVTKPLQPVTRPVTKPIARPARPVTRPVTKPVNRPAIRPVTKPAIKSLPEKKPVKTKD